jgi:predicted ATPase
LKHENLIMTIELLDEYKSLQPFKSEELSDLTIVTGKNGSGKSQLLELIGKKANNDSSVVSIRLQLEPAINKVQFEGLIKLRTNTVSYEQWRDVVQSKVNQFHQFGYETKNLITYLRLHPVDMSDWQKLYSDDQEYKELLSKAYSEFYNTSRVDSENINIHIQQDVFSRLNYHGYQRLFQFVAAVCDQTGKRESEFEHADFFKVALHESLIDTDDLFSSQIELIFYNYAKRRDENRRAYFDKKEDGVDNDAVPDSEFISMHRPPWEMINEILERHRIDFKFKQIERKFVPDAPLDFKLVKKSLGKAIDFADLSSGEKVIMGLILKLFTSDYYGRQLLFPELLVLDEPDAPLHPEMSKLLIDVLEETFVKVYSIKVIFTTHSPSTIALSPEGSIYQLQNGPGTSLTKISKDSALKILTSFIPTLSIDYRNHRQVFVESPTDVNYYQALYDRHSQSVKPDYKLYFLSNAAGKGNCTQVKEIVRTMRKAGNGSVYGIVDWDKDNKEEAFIWVHGAGERYSIENFLLDPIYTILVLVQMEAHGLREMVSIRKDENEYLIGERSNGSLQAMADLFYAEVERAVPSYQVDNNPTPIQYLNGKTIRVPQWALLNRGHDVEEKIKKAFPALTGKFRNEGELQEALALIMAKCYPFVPKTSIEILKRICMHHQ